MKILRVFLALNRWIAAAPARLITIFFVAACMYGFGNILFDRTHNSYLIWISTAAMILTIIAGLIGPSEPVDGHADSEPRRRQPVLLAPRPVHGGWISEAFSLVSKQAWQWCLGLLVGELTLGLLFYLVRLSGVVIMPWRYTVAWDLAAFYCASLNAVLFAGLFKMANKCVRGQTIGIGDVFSGGYAIFPMVLLYALMAIPATAVATLLDTHMSHGSIDWLPDAALIFCHLSRRRSSTRLHDGNVATHVQGRRDRSGLLAHEHTVGTSGPFDRRRRSAREGDC